jgi:hypothetical protein
MSVDTFLPINYVIYLVQKVIESNSKIKQKVFRITRFDGTFFLISPAPRGPFLTLFIKNVKFSNKFSKNLHQKPAAHLVSTYTTPMYLRNQHSDRKTGFVALSYIFFHITLQVFCIFSLFHRQRYTGSCGIPNKEMFGAANEL